MTKGDAPYCQLRAFFDEMLAETTAYTKPGGLTRSLSLLGWIDDALFDDPPGTLDQRFHCKAIRLDVQHPEDADWSHRIARHTGEAHHCGVVEIEAAVEPLWFETDGQRRSVEPVRASVFLTDLAFDALRNDALATLPTGRALEIALTLGGRALAAGPPRQRYLKDLDTSNKSALAVQKVWISTPRRQSLDQRVQPPPRPRDAAGTVVGVTLTQVDASFHSISGRLSKLSCWGRVTAVAGERVDFEEGLIEFELYERDSFGDALPRQSFAGAFRLNLSDGDSDSAGRGISFDLRYMPEDVDGLLLPLLVRQPDGLLELWLDVDCPPQRVLSATESFGGSVRSYGIEIKRALSSQG